MCDRRTKAPRRCTDGRKRAALGAGQRLRCYCYSCYTCYSWGAPLLAGTIQHMAGTTPLMKLAVYLYRYRRVVLVKDHDS